MDNLYQSKDSNIVLSNTSSSFKPKLILNFDINKTLMFGDAIKNQSYESSLLAIITEWSWGEVETSTNSWKLKEQELMLIQPKSNWISYKEYLSRKHAKKTKTEIADEKERTEYNTKMKREQEKVIQEFVNLGQPGESFKNKFEQILKTLKVSNEILCKIKTNPDYCDFQEIYKQGNYFIFLSLFFTMIKLTQEKREFSIIFRTFGSDFNLVIKEFNAFCMGKHPLFDGSSALFPKYYFDGSNCSRNYWITDKNVGMFFRENKDIEATSLLIGSTNRIKNIKQNEIKEKYKSLLNSNNSTWIEGGNNIYNYIEKEIVRGEQHSFVMNDEYGIWFANDNRFEFSKPMFIDPSNTDAHYIFFDDNIEEGEHSIVDCRNILTGETMNYESIINKFIVKVNPIQAAWDQDYFIKSIKECEENRGLMNKEKYE